ncbi:MAG TPA: hypothetical protein VLH40_05830 [Atribacteraceae bacterium]|nr:hypothetical protein [Atribacteraceae bacterium]
MKRFRCIDDPSLTGFENMSRDEAMLDLACSFPVPPTLRFFQWDRKTLSIGRLQRTDVVNIGHLDDHSIPLVRRPTGGRAILHDRELTFSLFLPLLFFGTALNLSLHYEQLKKVLYRFMESIDVDVDRETLNEPYLLSPYCFSLNVAHEITIGGKKIIGVAQARSKCGVLFQGSFILRADRQEIAACFQKQETVFEEISRNMITLGELLGTVPDRDVLIGWLVKSVEEVWECECRWRSWFEEEIERSVELMGEKYYPGSPFILDYKR